MIRRALFGHSGDYEIWTEGTKEILDDMHKRKINLADEIFMIFVGGYVGPDARFKIEYMITIGKMVQYLEPVS